MVPAIAIALYLLMILGLLMPSPAGFAVFVVPFIFLNLGGSIYVWFSAIGRMDHHDASPMLIPVAIVVLVVSTIIGMALGGWADTVVKGVISGIVITAYFNYLMKDKIGEWWETADKPAWFSYLLGLRYTEGYLERHREEFLDKIAEEGSSVFRNGFSDLIRADREIALAAIEADVTNFKSASIELQLDPEFCVELLSRDEYGTRRADYIRLFEIDVLKNSRVQRKIKSHKFWEYYFPDQSSRLEREKTEDTKLKEIFKLNCFDDQTAILKIIRSNPRLYRFLPDKFLSDRMVLEAAVEDSRQFEYAPEYFREDREIVHKAVRSSPWVLTVMAEKFQKDLDIVQAAIEGSSGCLAFLHSDLQVDREIVLANVKKGGLEELDWTSEELREELKNDRDLVLQVVEERGLAELEWVSERLRDDRDLVLMALKNTPIDELEGHDGYDGLWNRVVFGTLSEEPDQTGHHRDGFERFVQEEWLDDDEFYQVAENLVVDQFIRQGTYELSFDAIEEFFDEEDVEAFENGAINLRHVSQVYENMNVDFRLPKSLYNAYVSRS